MNLIESIRSVFKTDEGLESLKALQWEGLRDEFRAKLLIADDLSADLYGEKIGEALIDLDILSLNNAETDCRRSRARIQEFKGLLESNHIPSQYPEIDISKLFDLKIRVPSQEQDRNALVDFSKQHSWLNVEFDDLSFQPALGSYGDFYILEQIVDRNILGYIQIRNSSKQRDSSIDYNFSDKSTYIDLCQIINIVADESKGANYTRRVLLQAALTRMTPLGEAEHVEFAPPTTDRDDHDQRISLEVELMRHGFRENSEVREKYLLEP